MSVDVHQARRTAERILSSRQATTDELELARTILELLEEQRDDSTDCPECGANPISFHFNFQAPGGGFGECPNGHVWGW